ncbi:8859_t:CDS:2 [Ambispora gerdemannii]|uniref:8859_t:CDS:1 n=1 Tax=Ambispora gerdemannii TaxID=144530 RepID=A0A9N9D182_9GLOM|nr:8859_t:CDS:2 [Ambispora gerdemannii]
MAGLFVMAAEKSRWIVGIGNPFEVVVLVVVATDVVVAAANFARRTAKTVIASYSTDATYTATFVSRFVWYASLAAATASQTVGHSSFAFATAPLKWKRDPLEYLLGKKLRTETLSRRNGTADSLLRYKQVEQTIVKKSHLEARDDVCPSGYYACSNSDGCCPSGTLCQSGGTCSGGCGPNPVSCGFGKCCKQGQTCGSDGYCDVSSSSPTTVAPPPAKTSTSGDSRCPTVGGHVCSNSNLCCRSDETCIPYGSTYICSGGCNATTVNCGDGYCCRSGQVCLSDGCGSASSTGASPTKTANLTPTDVTSTRTSTSESSTSPGFTISANSNPAIANNPTMLISHNDFTKILMNGLNGYRYVKAYL